MLNYVSRLFGYCRSIIAVLILSVLLSGCFLDRAGRYIPPSELTVTPANICPQDPINVAWDVWTIEPCWDGRPVADQPMCSTINSPASSNAAFIFDPALSERSGSIDYNPGPAIDTSFSMTALVTTNEGMVRDDVAAAVNVIEVPSSITVMAAGLCADNAGIQLRSIVSRCVEINQMCIADSPAGRYTLSGWWECAPGSSADTCARPAFQKTGLSAGECIVAEDVGLQSFQGIHVLDVDWRQDPLGIGNPIPSDCEVEGSDINPDLFVILSTSCTGANSGCE